ncbi:ABC transporter ATP-binding protein, partial [Micrococcus sp. SIMBA_131]
MSAADVSRVRGVGAEADLDYTRAERRYIRRRSFRLLGALARPVRETLLPTVVFVLGSIAARAAGP